MYERFTDRARKCVSLARWAAFLRDEAAYTPTHLLLAIAHEGCGVGASALKEQGVDLKLLVKNIQALLLPIRTEKKPGESAEDQASQLSAIKGSPEANQLIAKAIEIATQLNHNYVGSEHLLLALAQYEDQTFQVRWKNLGIPSPEQIRTQVLKLLGADDQ